jgi:N utilization substance protein B
MADVARDPVRHPRESRHRAREAAVQMLYQWEVGRADMADVIGTFWSQSAGTDVPSEQREFSVRLATGVAEHRSALDPLIAEAAEHWRLERMAVLDRLILRLAVFEFLHEADTPRLVVINEALELARTFSGEEAVGFINGILDAIRRKLERA